MGAVLTQAILPQGVGITSLAGTDNILLEQIASIDSIPIFEDFIFID